MKTVPFLFLLVTSSVCFAQEGQVLPKDESSRDENLVQFIKKLKKAVIQRDTSFFKTSIATESYIPREGGETTTPIEFFEFYFNDSNNGYNIWKSLEYIFEIGGGGFKTNSSTEYYMPYTSANLNNSEPFTMLGMYVIALSNETPVYAETNINSDIIDLLNYHIVPNNLDDYQKGWFSIKLKSGRTGYLNREDGIYTIDVRCGFVKENDSWKIKYAGGFE